MQYFSNLIKRTTASEEEGLELMRKAIKSMNEKIYLKMEEIMILMRDSRKLRAQPLGHRRQ